VLDFLAVGDVMLDVHLPAPPSATRQHGVITSTAAGSAVNAARAAARLGARAGVAGAIGDDTVGRVVELEIEALALEAHLERVGAATTGTAVYLRDAVVADRGANALYVPHTLPPARVTLVSGYLPEPARRRALELARGITAVDLQGALDDEPGADVVLGPDVDVDALAQRHDVACATLGAGGAVAVRGSERCEAPAERVLEASPVGAGDGFAAGFLLALADGLPLAECLRRGCAAAIG
jgi:ribokinase